MKTFFENKTIYNKKLYLEAQVKWYKIHGKTTRYFAVAIGAFCLASAFYYGSKGAYAASAVFGIACLAAGFIFFRGNYFQAVKAYNQQKALFPKEGFYWIIQSNRMVRKTDTFDKEYYYQNINRVFETRNSICLVINGQIHIMDKSGFTHGSFQAFAKWLHKKCPKAFRR